MREASSIAVVWMNQHLVILGIELSHREAAVLKKQTTITKARAR